MTVSAMEATRRNHHAHAREDNEMDTDRDVIDTTTGSDDHDRVIRIIIARCADALSEEEIADIFEPDPSGAAHLDPDRRAGSRRGRCAGGAARSDRTGGEGVSTNCT